MELRPGYKQTEVGVIPDDWDVREVREFARVITGPFGTLLKASEYSEYDGVPLISVGEIGDGYFRISQYTPRIPSTVAKRLPQFLLREGDIVFGRKGAVDRSALVSDGEHGWFLGSDGISIRPTSNCYPPYLAVQFRGANTRTWLVQNAIGTTMASLNQGVLCRVKIPFPQHLPEQSAIAEALSDVDALLSGLDKLIAKKRDLKQAAIQQLLTGKKRLPGFSGAWEVTTLGELGTTYGGLVGKSKNDFGRGTAQYVPFVNVMANVVIDCAAFDNVDVGIGEAQNKVLKGDLLFNGSSETPEEVAMCALVDHGIENLFLNSFCFGFRMKADAPANGLFMAYYMRGPVGRELICVFRRT